MQGRYQRYSCLLFVFLLSRSLAGWAAPGLLLLENPLRRSFTGFASSLAVIGDLDGDAVPDYLVGAYEYHHNGSLTQGRAFVFSGRSGKLLFTIDNPYPRQNALLNPHHGPAFGCAVAAAGDVDRDGIPDLLIGAFNQESSGRAFVFSGKDGQLLYTLHPPRQQPGAGFGWAVAAAGDLSGDGVPEVMVGAFAQEGDGRVFVFRGHDGTLLHTLGPPSSSSRAAFGWAVTGGGDLNNDNVPDILVGAPYTTVEQVPVQGRVYAFSGRDGTLLYTINDPQPRPGAVFGWHLALLGDLNRDSVPDVLVGAPYKDVGAIPSQGMAFVFSGTDGTLLLPLHNPAPTKSYSGFGHAVAAGPDLNQDGIPEILVGAPYQTVDEFHFQGEVFLFDGRDGRHLATLDNPSPHQGSMFGYTVAVPGDVNSDGIPDIAIGAAGQSLVDKVAVGRVYVVLSRSEQADARRENKLHVGRRNASDFEERRWPTCVHRGLLPSRRWRRHRRHLAQWPLCAA